MDQNENGLVLKEIYQKLHSIDLTLALQQKSLDEHIRRTEINEQALATLQANMKPIEKHVIIMDGVLKIAGSLTIIITTVLAILQIRSLL